MATVKNTISLQDKMTPVLGKIIQALETTVNAMSNMDQISSQALSQIHWDLHNATSALQELGGTADTIPEKQESITQGFSGWQRAIIVANQALSFFKGTLARFGLIDFNRAFGRMDTMYNFERVMGIISGSTDAAKVMLEELNTTVRGTAYGLDTAARAAQGFVVRGIGLRKSTQLIKTWSDAVAFYGKGTNEELETVTDVLGRIISRGKVDMLQMKRLIPIGINAAGMYAQAVGRDTASVQDDLSKGTISAIHFVETLTKAMEEGTNGVHKVTGAALQAQGTWAVTFANMKAAGARGLIEIIKSVDRVLALFNLDPIMINLKNFGALIEKLFKAVANTIFMVFEKNQKTIGVFIKSIQFVKDIFVKWGFMVPLLSGIAAGMFAAQLTALIFAASLITVNAKLVLLSGQLVAIGLLIGAAVYLWREWGIIGKILATGLTVLAGAILTATIAQNAFNVSLWTNPITWIVAAVIAFIAVLAVLITQLINVWRTNLDFKYGFIKAWNDILNYFDLVPFYFKTVAYGIADAFVWAEIQVLKIMESMGNGVIKHMNALINSLNKIPGVSINPIEQLTFSASTAAELEAKKQNRTVELKAHKEEVAAKAAQRQAKMEADRALDEANLKAKQDAEDSTKKFPLSWTDLGLKDLDYGAGLNVDGGYLDEIGGIKDPLKITDQDLKLLKDVAATEFVNKFTTLKPEMKVTFGDVKETADVSQILQVIETMVEEAYASVLVGEGF